MRILFVNKFLYPNGGSETYCFKLAGYLMEKGHSVEFFGMRHEGNMVGNNLELYVSNSEFKGISVKKLLYPFKIIYSLEARDKIKKMLESFRPDIVHLNNYNFQITPSILYEIKKYNIPVLMTLHDFQLVCPNHMMYREHHAMICEECKGRRYYNCIRNKCVHNSGIKSALAAFEGFLYYKLKTYDKYIDSYIAPSSFLKSKVVEFGEAENRIITMHNFVNGATPCEKLAKSDYVLYFGRLSVQKGIRTLIKACRRLPEIKFVFAGSGELESELKGIGNIVFAGFKTREELKSMIKEALFSVYPSEWYENCPMSVLESQMYGTPVLGADIGGIPELIGNNADGMLFEPGNVDELVEKIRLLYDDRHRLAEFSERCIQKVKGFSIDDYYTKLIDVYHCAAEKHKRRGE